MKRRIGKTNTTKANIDRRTFLKGTSVAAGAVVAGSVLPPGAAIAGQVAFAQSANPQRENDTNNEAENNPMLFDFVVVGAGNAGCTIANRLSENGKYTVCLLEAGKDDSRVPETLPLASPAPVPQPGDYKWGSYVRGSPLITNFPGPLLSRGFSHFEWFQEEDENGPVPKRKTTQARHCGWGGCTSHNATIAIRNAPHNWAKWVAKGLTDWDASTPKSNLIRFYKKLENRTQMTPSGVLGPNAIRFFDPSLPAGTQGSLANDWYGTNGMVPLQQLSPIFGGAENPFVATVLAIIDNSLNRGAGFSYPTNLVDLDYPPTAAAGGLSYNTWTSKFQAAEIVPPPNYFELPQVLTSMAAYNAQMYPDMPLFRYPPEYARIGLTGNTVFERVSSAQAYLYPALSRANLTVLSEVLVTKIDIVNNRAIGVEYLQGSNIYQTGSNNSVMTAGYGGTAGDARANAMVAQRKGTSFVRAKKEVIICAGAFNTPQILQLSGIGDPYTLNPLGIRTVANVPGVGKELRDNNELFLLVQGKRPEAPVMMGAKSKPSAAYTDFELVFLPTTGIVNESADPFIQKGWLGTKHTPALYQNFVRNDFENTLIDTNQNPAKPADLNYKPIMVSPSDHWILLIEQEENVQTTGSVNVVSKDPTVPPKIVYNYMQHEGDMQAWVDMFYNNVAPILLAMKTTPYFTNLLDPAPFDFLQTGITYSTWTSVDQIDKDKLVRFFQHRVGGHHAMGSCKMGVTDSTKRLYDPLAVVDQKGRVKNVEGLRICDASIFPVSIRWPNITLYVVAEKIAADILTAW